jgi:hypothetical protein
MKKFLQKVFKFAAYFIFFKIYGKIIGFIESADDNRAQTKNIKTEDNFNYNIYTVANGRLYTDRIHDTAIILDNKIINGPSFQLRYDGSQIYNSSIKDNIVLTKGTPRKLKEIKGTVLSLLTGGAGNNNYWHWLYDVLPRLYLCSKIEKLKEIDFFLCPSLSKKFQYETLDLLNIPRNKRLSSEIYRHIKTQKLIVTDHPVVVSGDMSKDIQNIPGWILKWLRNSFIDEKVNENEKINIYIDRKDSLHANERLITNESEVKKYLLDNKFISVNLSEIPFKEQVNLFNKAKCVAGLHGAGFANIVFCKPGTKIIELRSEGAGPMFGNLAQNNHLNYCPIITSSNPLYESKYPNQQGAIQVPINSLNNILKK